MIKKLMANTALRIAVNILITLIVGGVYFYINLPAINLHEPAFYFFLGVLAVVYAAISLLTMGKMHMVITGQELWRILKAHCQMSLLVCIVLVLVYLVGQIVSAPIFRAGAYHNLLAVETGDFAVDVAETSFENIPMLDWASAARLGDRKMGELSDLVSQFEVDNSYAQINYRDRPVRVTYLNYGDFFKWWNNRGQGLPAYITVDMVTQEANVVRLSDMELPGIRYSPSELFNRKLERHLRFTYPTFMFDTPIFEIDDEGMPWWICPKIEKTIGLFGGTDIHGAVLVNAISGESTYVEDIPNWVDRVYSADLIVQQYDYYGTYVNGFWNSMIGQRNVTVTTQGYNYIAMNDDVYMYTGVTSVGGDESNIGFLMSNQRTKQTTYYAAAGAIEASAQRSAEGVVQDLGYSATFPLLLNVAGEPTYFMSLKDASQLVKQYAMVNVRQYQIVATGITVSECQANYLRLLNDQGVTHEAEVTQTSVGGVIDDLRFAVLNGNTQVYIKLVDDNFYYVVSVAESEVAAILGVGDHVSMQTFPQEGELHLAYDVALEKRAVPVETESAPPEVPEEDPEEEPADETQNV